MKRYIFVLLLFLSCSDKNECGTKLFNCFTMTIISDSLPIQFWQNDEPTFNDKTEAGIEKICFYQPFNMDDVISLQIQDDTPSAFFSIIATNEDGDDVYDSGFTEDVDVPGSYNISRAVSAITSSVVGKYSIRIIRVTAGPVAVILAYSDLIDVQLDHADSRLIRYSNGQDFASIQYDGDTVPEFQIRVFSRFYKQRHPQDDESEALSDGSVVKLSGTVKTQRLFETEPLPPYLIKKLALIFQHDTIYINNLSWLKEENYETDTINERFALFLSKVWLTQSTDNFIANA